MKANVLDDLLPYYERELAYLREMGAAFAEKNHHVAGRLEMGGGESPDPHVERLLESFAFLTARIQYNIESEFPEISAGLLNVLYPQFLRPVPAMAVAHAVVDPKQGPLDQGFALARHTPLFAEAQAGVLCRFRTAYDVRLWPFRVAEVAFEPTARYALFEAGGETATVLRVRLECEAGVFGTYACDRLRFHLGGERATATALYELLFAHLGQVALLPEGEDYPQFLSAEVVRPVGFARDEAVLPYPGTVHPGYRLLHEYFAFPEKFLFFELHPLALPPEARAVDLLFLLGERPARPLAVDARNVMLNCVPVVNLFPKTTEPIRLDHRQTAYPLVPDVRRERTTEIHSILTISASSAPDDDTHVIQPYFSYDHASSARAPSVFWHARRRPPRLRGLPGTDVEVTFTDLAFRPETPALTLAFGHTLCTNRHLAEELRKGALLQVEQAAPVREVYCLEKPTRPLDPTLGGAMLWRLISHLSLNYLSLAEGPESLTALREILRLYGTASRRDITVQLGGLRELRTRRVLRRMGQEAWRGFCEGTEVTLLIDERNFTGGEGFLLAAVLNRFVALYASVNSFTQLVARSTQREGIWKTWEPLAGDQNVL